MWIALLAACSGNPTDDAPTIDEAVPFALSWGSSNRSEAVIVQPDGEGGFYAALELAAPARTDGVLVSVDGSGTEQWQVQWGSLGDDEVDTLLTLDDGRVMTGGRSLLNPSTDSDSIAVLTSIDPEMPAVVDEVFWSWNASDDVDRISSIEDLQGGLSVFGGAGPQLLAAEVDDKGKLVRQERFGDERRTVQGSIVLGDRDYVAYGQVADPLDFNDPGQVWVAEIRDDKVVREVEFGERYQVEDRATDVVVLDDGAWLVAGELGTGDVLFAAVEPSNEVRFEVVWDSGGEDLVPQLAVAPDGTVFAGVVRDRDDLLALTLDPATGTVEQVADIRNVDGIRDLYVDDERYCAALALPGDVAGGYLASLACALREAGGFVWPALR